MTIRISSVTSRIVANETYGIAAIKVLRLAAAVSVCEDEVAQFSFTTHDIEDVDAFVSVAIEDPAGANDEFSIARAAEFRRPST